MAEAVVQEMNETGTEPVVRIYEVGYHIIPTVAEENLEKVVGGIRATIEKAGGSFIAEGAPTLTKLAYPRVLRMGQVRSTSRHRRYARGDTQGRCKYLALHRFPHGP